MNSEKQSEIGLMARETLDVAVRRIAQEKLYQLVNAKDGSLTYDPRP